MKKLFSFVLSVAFVLLLVGCSGDPGSVTTRQTAADPAVSTGGSTAENTVPEPVLFCSDSYVADGYELPIEVFSYEYRKGNITFMDLLLTAMEDNNDPDARFLLLLKAGSVDIYKEYEESGLKSKYEAEKAKIREVGLFDSDFEEFMSAIAAASDSYGSGAFMARRFAEILTQRGFDARHIMVEWSGIQIENYVLLRATEKQIGELTRMNDVFGTLYLADSSLDTDESRAASDHPDGIVLNMAFPRYFDE